MEFNWLAQIVAAVAALLVGFVWYNPKVFGNVWMRSINLSPDAEGAGSADMAKMFSLTLVYAFLAGLVVTYFVSHGGPEYATVQHGIFHGAELGFALALPIIGVSALYERRNFTYVAISTGYWVVTLALMGAILSVWR